jgi:hypothetical protein
MSRRFTTGLVAATTLVAMSLLAGSSALAQTYADADIGQARRDCNVRQQQCGKLDGDELDQCLLHNGHIQHACNFVRKWEADPKHGGCGSKCNAADKKTTVTGHADSALDADEPAPRR